MKKVAIVTLTKNPNYGNALQNIALHNVLHKIGVEAQTVINYDGSSLFIRKGNIKYYCNVAFNRHNLRGLEKRRKRFVECISKYVRFSKAYWIENHIQNFSPSEFDYFIAGSDQIWNPFFGLASSFEMLDFVPVQKRISYAASFGVSSLDGLEKNKIEFISQSLKKFQALSVREKAGVEIAKEIAGVDAELCLDPTMLMGAEEWDEFLEKPNIKLPTKYVAVYMLGSVTEEYEKEIANIARDKNAEVVNLLSNEFFYLNPLEFAWMIKNSLFVCTDSFHAMVFSVIYHRSFMIFDRKDKHKNQNSRFDTLLSVCGIDAINNINWSAVDERISLEKKKSMNYLIKALGEA